jgi:hypothetical protein
VPGLASLLDQSRLLVRVVIGIGIATLVGLALSWPRGTAPDLGAQPNIYVDATVKSVDRSECEVVDSGGLTGCQRATVTLESGRDKEVRESFWLVGTIVIAFVAFYLAHGVNLATTVALAGTMANLALTGVLVLTVASAARLSGVADEQAQVLRVTAGALNLQGLLVAGIVVGALGV